MIHGMAASDCSLLWQVRERAYRVWGGEEELEAEKQRRMAAKEKKEVKKYAKQVRGTLIDAN